MDEEREWKEKKNKKKITTYVNKHLLYKII